MSKSKIILNILPIVVVAMIGVPITGMAAIESTKLLGLRAIPVPVLGTGSMYPSLYWSIDEGGPEDEAKTVVEEYRTTPHLYRRFNGITVVGHTFLRRQISYGDMVAFNNEKTAEILKADGKDQSSGFIKRVIGVPGDVIELRDGFIYKNSELLTEPYISSPRSTYGGSGLKDCIKLRVPQGSYFVLGDNRKVSSDSRFELGQIQENDIKFILPYSEQKIYQSLWRDPTKDNELLGQPTLSATEFVSLVNEVRTQKGLAKLSLKPSLIKSTTARGQHLLASEFTSYGLKEAVASAGYSNIVLGEFISYGHFSAKELLQNLLFHPSTAKQILNKDFSDLGVTDVNQEIAGCPTQIIVGHLGGYLPATYDEGTLSSWRNLRENLRSILPSWEQAQGYNNIDQGNLASLLTILRRRLALTEEIITTMENKEWLSDAQQMRIKQDEADAKAAESLASQLNKP